MILFETLKAGDVIKRYSPSCDSILNLEILEKEKDWLAYRWKQNEFKIYQKDWDNQLFQINFFEKVSRDDCENTPIVS